MLKSIEPDQCVPISKLKISQDVYKTTKHLINDVCDPIINDTVIDNIKHMYQKWHLINDVIVLL